MIGDVKNLAALSPSGPAGSLNADMQPAPFKYDFGKMKSTDVLAEEQKVIPQLAQAQADLKRAEMQYEQNLAGEKAKATEKIASDVRDKVTETQKKEAEFPFPEFHPTQENAQSLGELFSLVSTVGLMLGSSGKMASMNALGAMNGMLQGWQKGRADLYKKEKDIFDKEFQRIKTIRESLRKDLMDYMSLVPYDKEAAMYKAEEIARKAGSSSIISAYMNKQQPEMALKILDSAGKVIRHKEDMEAKARQHRETLQSQERLRQAALDQGKYQFFTTADGKVVAVDTKHPERQPVEVSGVSGDITKLGSGGKGSSAQVTSERVMQQDIGNAVFNLKDLKAIGEKEGKIPGGSVAFAGQFKGDISSYIKRYIETQTIEADPQTIDALMTNLAFDIASAQTGGRGQLSDTKVKAVVSQMPLESQPESTKKARWRAVVTRVDEANKTLPENKKIEIPSEVKKYFGVGDEQSSAPSGPKEGDKTVSKSGKPIIFTNGKWEYQ
jgi:hypothetical protein